MRGRKEVWFKNLCIIKFVDSVLWDPFWRRLVNHRCVISLCLDIGDVVEQV